MNFNFSVKKSYFIDYASFTHALTAPVKKFFFLAFLANFTIVALEQHHARRVDIYQR